MDKKKILVVEDDPVLGVMYKTKLEAEGYEIVLAVNGADGLTMAQQNSFDIVLLDVILPQLDGFSVLAELKTNEVTKNVPVIMLTNLSTTEDKEKGLAMGAADYLVKAEYTPEQLSEAINKYIK
ncbi:MAG: response regulator [Candidatus Falkowbacteria bacterium]